MCAAVLLLAPVLAVAVEPPVKLNGPMVAGGSVSNSQVSPDGSRVVYVAELDVDGVRELYSVPIRGGTPVKLNPPLVNGGDGSTVVYQSNVAIDELFSVPIGGGAVTRLNAPLPADNEVGNFDLSADGSVLIYSTESNVFSEDSPTGLFSVPIHGGSVVPLAVGFPQGSGVNIWRISPNSNVVAYSADQDSAGVEELYQIPIRGGRVDKLSGTMTSGGDVSNFHFSPNGRTVIYAADQYTDEVDELFSVALEPDVPDRISAGGFD
jgi:Tol biopolymer transport system component